MSIKTEVNQILAVVNAQTQAIGTLTSTVANIAQAIAAGAGGAPVDLTPVTAALTTLQAAVDKITVDLESDTDDTAGTGAGS